MRIGSLCSGSGMLDEGIRSFLGGTVAWHAETDPGARAVLAYRYPKTPNLGDLTAIDWTAVAPIDLLSGGYPCQPFSYSGSRKGTDDERHLWPHVAEAIRQLRPGFVVLENVPGHRSLGFDTVLADLAAMRYVGSWRSLRACDVGAPHRRERLFIVARDSDRVAGAPAFARGRDRGALDEPGAVERAERPVGAPAADAHGDGLPQFGREHTCERDVHRRRCADVAWGPYEPAVRRWEALTRPAPAPRVPGPRGERLFARFSEWMMGWPDGWVTDVPGVDNESALAICGNGVVPQQASEALRRMLSPALALGAAS